METIHLSPVDLSIASGLVLALAVVTGWLGLAVSRRVIIAAIRTFASA